MSAPHCEQKETIFSNSDILWFPVKLTPFERDEKMRHLAKACMPEIRFTNKKKTTAPVKQLMQRPSRPTRARQGKVEVGHVCAIGQNCFLGRLRKLTQSAEP